MAKKEKDVIVRGESGLAVDEELFVHAWIANGFKNVSDAYQHVYPDISKPVAQAKGNVLLQHPGVKGYISGLLEAQLAKYEVTEERIIAELSYLAFLDPGDAVNDDGSVIKKIKDLPEETRRCIAGITEDVSGKVTLKFRSKEKALELLAKYKKLLTEMHIISTDADLCAEIMAARKRLSAMEKSDELAGMME